MINKKWTIWNGNIGLKGKKNDGKCPAVNIVLVLFFLMDDGWIHLRDEFRYCWIWVKE